MAGALGVVLTGDTVPVEGRAAIPVYVDDSLPIVGPSRACVVTTGEIPQAGGPPLAVRLAPAGTPAIGPALPVYIVPGGGSLGGADTLAYTNKVIALSPIAYWPMAESSGLTALDASGNGRNGTYSAVTLGQTGIGDGRTAALFSSSYVNIYSASLEGALSVAEGTLSVWFQFQSAGIWTDAAARQFIQIRTDANNLVALRRTSTNNQLQSQYVAGGTSKTVNITSVGGSVAWNHFALTWSKSADQMIAYINGAQSGAIQTGLGVWAGALSSTLCLIGASTQTPGSPMSGLLAHAAVWASPLSAAQIATLAVVP